MHDHSGHRERLRRTFETGGEDMTDAQLLELLLSYSIPRRDVRPLAEELAAKIRDLSALDKGELRQIRGVGETTARLLELTAETVRRAAAPRRPGALITSPEAAVRFLRPRLRDMDGAPLGVFLDGNMRVAACGIVDMGLEDIAWQAAGFDSKAVILGVRYADGHYSPDVAQVRTVRAVREGLTGLEITLLDYIIIGRTRYTSLYADRLLRQDESFRTRYRPERDSSRVYSWAQHFTAHELPRD